MAMTPLHVAIIMDGSGRWASARGLPRVAGHRRGADRVREVAAAAPALGIGTLTLYAFSADNWHRPAGEVHALMSLFADFLQHAVTSCRRHDVRLSVIGRRDRLHVQLLAGIDRIERATADGRCMHLRLAIDYSGREAIWLAAARSAGCRERFSQAVGSGHGEPAPVPDVDLLIRTGGEQRLSDFMLWESAYAELYFTATMWPEFGPRDLEAALAAFHRRDRRFGRLPASTAPR